jgi:hypothetical protein
MTNDLIEKFIEKRGKKTSKINIHFKQRNTLQGIFIQAKDYNELKSKNFWRIVSETNSEEWKRTGDQNLARIFNGAEFTRLSESE